MEKSEEYMELRRKIIKMEENSKTLQDNWITKENTISILRDKLTQKNNDLVRCEQELDEISQRLSLTLKRKEELAQKMTEKEVSQVHLEMEK